MIVIELGKRSTPCSNYKNTCPITNEKWEYFSIKGDFKEAITSYAYQSGRNLKLTKMTR